MGVLVGVAGIEVSVGCRVAVLVGAGEVGVLAADVSVPEELHAASSGSNSRICMTFMSYFLSG